MEPSTNLYESYSTSYEQLRQSHIIHLQHRGVELPGKHSILGCALVILFRNQHCFMEFDKIKNYVIPILKAFPTPKKLKGGNPLQIRHLSTQKGWNIIKDGRYKYKLLTVTQPYPSFKPQRREVTITPLSWKQLKQDYQSKCATCGNLEGTPHRYYGEVVALQQGHMDPRLPLTENNCIPQCQGCNRHYKNKAIFNKNGGVNGWNKKGFT